MAFQFWGSITKLTKEQSCTPFFYEFIGAKICFVLMVMVEVAFTLWCSAEQLGHRPCSVCTEY